MQIQTKPGFKQNTPSLTAIPAFNSPSSYSWCRARRLGSATRMFPLDYLLTVGLLVSRAESKADDRGSPAMQWQYILVAPSAAGCKQGGTDH